MGIGEPPERTAAAAAEIQDILKGIDLTPLPTKSREKTRTAHRPTSEVLSFAHSPCNTEAEMWRGKSKGRNDVHEGTY